MWLSCLKKSIYVCFFVSVQAHAFDKLSVDEHTGLFTVTDKTIPVVTTQYIGWEAGWKWAGAEIRLDNAVKKGVSAPTTYLGEVAELDMCFSSLVSKGKGQISWAYKWDKKTDHPKAIGFGVEFNLQTSSPSFEMPAQAPELLPDNQGWRWQTPDGQNIEVKFSPAVAKIYFEREQKNLIRVLFFSKVEKGSQKTTMIVNYSNNVALASPLATQYGDKDTQNWQRDILSENISPVDLSFLNKQDTPAGKHGFVKAKSDKLVFEDGTPTKFWGGNLMAYALFTTSDIDIKAQAKRIAQLGFNLMRIHHLDSPWVQPNIFKNQADNTQELSPEAFKKLDWWIKCLKDQGVYVWLDLHVGRAMTRKDGIEDFEDLAQGKGNADIKGFNYYNESVQKQMQKFNEAYLNHVNPFTKLAYKADPAVIALLITNENDLTQHFGNSFLPDKGVPKHNAIFNKDVAQFSKASGLSSDKVSQTWEMGESKVYLSDAEHRFNHKMLTHLRGLGAKSMVATTNSWGYMGLFGLPSLTDGDLIDSHSYGVAEEFNFNPHYNPSYLAWIGAAQVTGKPLSVTEWNIEGFPATDRFTAPIYTASIANLQGWDAMMLYGYSQLPLSGKNNGSNYSAYNDPAIIGLMPAAALLYRQNHVAAAKQNYELKLSEHDFFHKKQDPTTSKAIRTLLETSRFSVAMPDAPELPWLKGNNPTTSGGIAVTDANKDFISMGQDFVLSDTGELKRNWVKGIQTIDTEKSKVVSGWVGGEKIGLGDVSFNISTKKAVIAVQSLGGKPISKSSDIFITVMARSQPDDSNATFLTEPVAGSIEVKAPKGLRLYPITSLGTKAAPVVAKYQDGKYIIDLSKNRNTHWYKLSGD
jgi:Cellulase (glycosyl hydrolase family 5)